jgi:CubicO group peptidase (beta-lactamase class C family)
MRIKSMLVSALLASAIGASAFHAPVVAQASVSAVTIPDTPAGRQFKGWLEAFNSDDPSRILAFLAQESPGRPAPPGNASLRQMTGGFEVARVEASGDSQIVVLLRERDWEGSFARLTLDVGADGKIAGTRLQQAGPPPGWPPIARMSEAAALAALKDKLDAASAAGQFSGAVRVARNGTTVFDYVGGQAHRANGIANTLDTRFRIGSMNKMFTAVSVLQLVETGKIDLDAPIGTYLVDYPNKDLAARVTVRHLLTHTGGTGDIFTPEFMQKRLELCEPRDYIGLYGTRDVAFAPGDRFAYSNYGYVLLGAIVEAVSGESYYDYVREHLYRPAAMTASDSLAETAEVSGLAVGYTLQGPQGPYPEARPNSETLPCRGSPAGGGYSTVGDLIRFAEGLRTGKLLGPELLQAATTRQVAMGPGVAGYGFGFASTEVNGAREFGHNGGAPGMAAELMIFPELGYEVAIAANMDTQLVSRLALYLGARLPEPGET